VTCTVMIQCGTLLVTRAVFGELIVLKLRSGALHAGSALLRVTPQHCSGPEPRVVSTAGMCIQMIHADRRFMQ
jgi:hypothetical protein